jgi:bacterioferritin-associated ferredoxin
MGHDYSHDHHHSPLPAADPLDEEICVCFHVRRRKVEAWCRREKPRVPSQVSACLGAGTGCGWCIPFLKAILDEVVAGGPKAAIPTRAEYLEARKAYHRKKGIDRA